MDTAQDLRSQAMAAMSEGIHSSTRTTESYSACINLYMEAHQYYCCLLYTSPSPRDRQKSRMPSSA